MERNYNMKIKEGFTKVWNYLDGKKFWIGIAGHAVWLTTNLIFKDLATAEQTAYGHLIIGSVTGVGLGHKAVKWYDGKK